MENKSRKLFLHAAFSVPERVVGGSDAEKGEESTQSSSTLDVSRNTRTQQHRFDGSNCKPAIIGLPETVEPVKVSACNGGAVYWCAMPHLITEMQQPM